MKVSEFLLQTLEKNGVTHIFGNPGTTEIPLVNACEKRGKIKYIIALSEVAAVPMADGYARATRALGVVNLHVAPGLGNGMGALYTAGIAGTPLLVLVGGQDRRFLHTRPVLWGPLEKMAGSVCKAVYALDTRHDAAANVKSALRTALTPPYGPVALICPPDLLEQEIDAAPATVNAPRLSTLGAEDARGYARFLATAKRPALIAAEDVHWSNAGAELEALAKRSARHAAPYTGAAGGEQCRVLRRLSATEHETAERPSRGARCALFHRRARVRTTLYGEGSCRTSMDRQRFEHALLTANSSWRASPTCAAH